MIKAVRGMLKADREGMRLPRAVQDIIPVRAVYEDGIFRLGRNKFSRTYRFADINYATASRPEKEQMLLRYAELINSFDGATTTKITVCNRQMDPEDFEKSSLIPDREDGLDLYRDEYNRMLKQKAAGSDSIVQEKYITVSVYRKDIEDARTCFNRIEAQLQKHLTRMGSSCTALDAENRLRIFHDFFRKGDPSPFCFDPVRISRRGHDFRDSICPDSMEFSGDCFRMGNRYGRVLFLREYASCLKDNLITRMTELNRSLMLSIDVIPVPPDEAVDDAEKRLLGVETDITRWQDKQNRNNNFSATLPYMYAEKRQDLEDFLDGLRNRDQRMLLTILTLVHTADTKKQLDEDTAALMSIGKGAMCQFGVLKFQQLDGLVTALPFGARRINAFRTLITESLAVQTPFRVQDICHEHGIYYGQNVISKNMILADRGMLLNGNSFITGSSGGGKSFAAKGEIVSLMLAGDADIIILDPEREYGRLVQALGGQVIDISAVSENHINALDLNREYGDGANPVVLKSEFIMSLCEKLIGTENLGPRQKSIIDRCTANVYREYQEQDYTGKVPTLKEFREELLRQREPEAKEIALALEMFTQGTLDTFARPTNVNTDSRLICYDILDLGKELMEIGMLVVLDSVLNRITRNRAAGRKTYIYIDEIYLLFQQEYSANFLFTLWKRVRKYGAFATGITQNVHDLLQSHAARTMLANSEFIIMLNQGSTDREALAELLKIPEDQMAYITDVEAGHGLIKIGSAMIPFENRFPRDTRLYQLMTTKPGEVAGTEEGAPVF